MKLNPFVKAGIGLSFALLWSCPTLAALTEAKNFGLEVKATAQSEDDRDLGTQKGGDVNGIDFGFNIHQDLIDTDDPAVGGIIDRLNRLQQRIARADGEIVFGFTLTGEFHICGLRAGDQSAMIT